ncbi:MAG: response regulator [Bacteroidota bacterium]
MTVKANIKTVLIADNSYENLALYGKRLKQEGFTVLTAIDGKQAIAIAQNKTPEVIVVQKNIPLVDGFVLDKIIRSNPLTSDIAVIVLANEHEITSVDHSFGFNKANIFLNPPNLDQLIERVYFLAAESYKSSFDPPKNQREKRILIVEDNELNQIYISSVLIELGIKHDIAENGEKALDYFLSKPYDLILMDVNIPLINGIELTQIIRSKHKSFLPIIAITGHSEKELIDKCLHAGMNAFLTKPFQAQALKSMILNEISQSGNSTNNQLSTNADEGPGARKYDYNQAIKLSNGDKELFEKWLNRFLGLVKTGIDFIESSVNENDFTKRNKVFHELINYSGYFGVDELRLYIKELQSIQKFTTDNKRLENFYRKINAELKEIEMYFIEISKQTNIN